MKFHVSIFIIALFTVSACAPVSEFDSPAFMDEDDNIALINLPSDSRSISTEWEYDGSTEINWANYIDIDSIVLVAELRSQTTEDQCIAELYDYTNNRTVPSSEVSSNVRYFYHSVRSRNLINSVDLNTTNEYGLRFRSTRNGHFVALGSGSKIIIYHN